MKTNPTGIQQAKKSLKMTAFTRRQIFNLFYSMQSFCSMCISSLFSKYAIPTPGIFGHALAWSIFHLSDLLLPFKTKQNLHLSTLRPHFLSYLMVLTRIPALQLAPEHMTRDLIKFLWISPEFQTIYSWRSESTLKLISPQSPSIISSPSTLILWGCSTVSQSVVGFEFSLFQVPQCLGKENFVSF